ncbi:hypothetical protein ILUMI_00275 [Ignelater luminosus]|uniref:Uncharacterized protein n=1 Tax=Ignelater luminosus TaxID=2038154 RepID=A0A8K0DGK0_IGNLU|nr:hypothetical protein ILUMI_00275 [Ignelater luminosus]
MFFKLVALAITLQISFQREFFQDKSILQTFMTKSENGSTNVHGEKYVKVYDPNAGKYAYKKIIYDNGNVQRESGFLDGNNDVKETTDTGISTESFTNFFTSIKGFMKNLLDQIMLLR